MFFILDTAKRLGFSDIMNDIKPLSPQGQTIKDSIEPFLPGQKKEFKRSNQRLRFWMEIIDKKDIITELKPLLEKLKSISGILERLEEGEVLYEGECFEIKANLIIARKIQQYFDENILYKPSIDEPIFSLNPMDKLWKLFNPGGIETERFYLHDEYDPELAEIRDKHNQLQQEYRDKRKEVLAALEKRLGRSIPASGEIMVSKTDQKLVEHLEEREDVHLERENFSTYFYRWFPGEELEKLQEKIRLLNEEEKAISQWVLKKLSKKIRKFHDQLVKNQTLLGELDWMLARTYYALAYNCVPAELTDDNMINIKRGRHLLVEKEVHSRGYEYTPIDLKLENGVTVITGSNMGGKTVNLRMSGLLVAMAQHGLCVPADKMIINLREFIYFSVEDDQTKGDLSTFGQEIVGLNRALTLKDKKGLYLIDELARGTNPKEGGALGKAIIRYLLDSPAMTILTTHFSTLTEVEGVRHLRVKGLDRNQYEYIWEVYNQKEGTVSLEIINLLMDYYLIEVDSETEMARDAVRVASLLGLPEQIIEQANLELDYQK